MNFKGLDLDLLVTLVALCVQKREEAGIDVREMA